MRKNDDFRRFSCKYFVKFTEGKRNKGTRGLYEATMRRMEAFDPSIRTRSFEDITREWLSDFDAFMAISVIDQQLYTKYHLTNEEITFIEKMIKTV
jgi:hypothetical protein